VVDTATEMNNATPRKAGHETFYEFQLGTAEARCSSWIRIADTEVRCYGAETMEYGSRFQCHYVPYISVSTLPMGLASDCRSVRRRQRGAYGYWFPDPPLRDGHFSRREATIGRIKTAARARCACQSVPPIG
jgi:hypothetical protein